MHGVQHRPHNRGVVLHLQRVLFLDERGRAAFKTDSAWPRRISAFSMSAGSNHSVPAIYLLPTPSSISDCRVFSIAHMTAAWSATSSASFARMSDGVQLSKPTALGQEEYRTSARQRAAFKTDSAWPRRISAFSTPPPFTCSSRCPLPATTWGSAFQTRRRCGPPPPARASPG